MQDELTELFDAAIYKEIASEAFYIAAQRQTEDSGAKELLKELAQQEVKHATLLKNLRQKGWDKQAWHKGKVKDLMLSEYLTGGNSLEGAGLQDTLIFAIKREQQSVEFYSRMMGTLNDKTAKSLCQRLVSEETTHKMRLEIFYDDLFYREH